MNCPDCDRELHGKPRCACGWVALPTPGRSSTAEDIERQWARSKARSQEEANEFCQKMGLDTREKQMAYIKQVMSDSKFMRGGKHMGKPTREPGEDEAAA